ncbi:MAG: UvrD-helicase domain-containing protein, partial [Burkholderiaceae bacterium]
MSEALDPLTVPLQGSRLIEASAGTGKTWTLAALYLRLVLGHGAPGRAPPRALAPGEILVMTFTKAATRELSDRIRCRLVEAAACFRLEAVPHDDDAFLAQLLAHCPPGPERAAAAWRLAMAAQAMDDAAVYTIDAWCQRMLREHAFDSGCLFDEELQAHPAALLAEAARDYWRQQIYPLSGAPLGLALAQWKDVDALIAAVRPLLERPLPSGAGQGTLNACIEAASAQRLQALAALKQGWVERAADMLAWLERQWTRKDCALDKRALGQAHGTRWIAALSAWAQDPEAEILELGRGAERLTRSGVTRAIKPGASVEVPACFAEFESLMAALPTVAELGPALRVHAGARVTARMQQLKAQAGTYGFADMLERLNDALDESRHGERALRLRQRIVDQYPVALVDEFQDTSPVQLSIFERLYRIETNDPARALLLIGDPKQSIYGFRGADIYSYLEARHATRGRHDVLGTNHRSTKALVEVVNQLFAAAEARHGPGAFMFRPATERPADRTGRGSVRQASGLPFAAVAAVGRAERLVQSSGAVSSVTLCLDTELRSAGESRTLYAALCAEHIVTLLNDTGAGFKWPEPREPTFQRLRPADIAVLVRTGVEAAAVRQALRRRGVASVYLSDKDTVFETDEARDLLRLLESVAAPRDVRLARAALATSLLGLTLAELVALAVDDERFDARCELLRQLNVVWQTQGALAMVRRALHGFGLPARWLAGDDGERRLTNVLHLGELLQSASSQLDGERALIRWMAQQIEVVASGQGGDEAQVLRLESDADLVKVVTVYKSKGLEYLVVLLPFAAHFRAVEHKNSPVVVLPDAQGGRTLLLAPTDDQMASADVERQREDLRLLYVALTR